MLIRATYCSTGTYRTEILGCALVGSLGILLIDALILHSGIYYYGDDNILLYSVSANKPMAIFRITTWFRPLEYLILVAANNVYLPLWLGASLLCAVGATILSALACELLFERQLPKAEWWILGLANPLLVFLVGKVSSLTQGFCNLLFAGAMLAFISELHQLRDRPRSGWHADAAAALLNLIAAGLFFTKETALAAAVVLPAATSLMRLKARRLSPIFLLSLLLPIGAASAWTLIKLQFPLSRLLYPNERYGIKLNPVTWVENFIVTLAFPITPLPSSFIGFELLRPLWMIVALGSAILFIGLLLRESARQWKLVLPLLVVAASCAPMILIHSSEIYSTMIGPFTVSIVLLFDVSKLRWPSLAYGLLLYAASLGNGIIYCLGSDSSLLGLKRLTYSIYSNEEVRSERTCPIGTTAHVAWDGTAAGDLPGSPQIKGRITCIR
jgi:hypothetical protein